MANAGCPRCGKKQFSPSTRKCYECKGAQRPDGMMVDVPEGYAMDEYGNLRTPVVGAAVGGKLIVTFHYLLEAGKTTPRGAHPKLAREPSCVYPGRLSCNFGEGFQRCEFMTYDSGRWICSASSQK